MRLACIHTHTNFCDGSGDVETFCRRAHEKGLVSLGFSAHAPITAKTGFPGSWLMPEERLPEYIETVRAAKKRWEGKLPVYLGLEVDFIPGLIGPADRYYRELGLDYTIGSVHFVIPPRGEPFTVDDSYENVCRGIIEGYGGDPMGMVEAYYSSLAAMIRAGGFDLLGHPDLVKKNNSDPRISGEKAAGLKTCGNTLFSEDGKRYREMTASIAALMAGTGVPAEVNTGGINRGKIKDCYPSRDFLKLFHERGVPMVINADAHRPEDLDGHYGEAREAMLRAGYTETLIFGGRGNGRPVWNGAGL